MRILITGAHGQVGWSLAHQGRERGMEVVALGRQGLDITNAQRVQAAVAQWRPALIINAAAYTAVDRAEQEASRAYAINRDGAAHLAAVCADAAIPLFHLSTDYVFDGSAAGAYRESDPVAPLGVYGDSKWQGEEAVRGALAEHLIIRISWVFGVHGNNFVKTMLRLAEQRDHLQVVADQRGCPTAAADVAAVLLDLAQRQGRGESLPWGTYHYCGTPDTSWHGFAQQVFATAARYGAKVPSQLEAIGSDQYPTAARRPANSVLDTALIESRLGVRPRPWSEALSVMLQTLLCNGGDDSHD